MLHEQGLENVFARHARHAEATRRAVRAWGLEIVCADPERYSSSVTAVFMPPSPPTRTIFAKWSSRTSICLSAAGSENGGRVRYFRIGHLGDFNDLMLAGTLSGVEMGLTLAGVPHTRGGVAAAFEYLTERGTRDTVREQALQAVLETASQAT
jgi:alanine-glyoxylate transaminase/serine-glyoxylate transaminase/serine-pyruvate transaminase